jgi:polar amino acid transport system substrate-binding protein
VHTPERSQWLKFSIHPTLYNPITVFMRKENVIPFKSWDELKPLRGGVTSGDSFGNGFDEYLKENLKVEVISNMSGNFLKLNSERIDYSEVAK